MRKMRKIQERRLVEGARRGEKERKEGRRGEKEWKRKKGWRKGGREKRIIEEK